MHIALYTGMFKRNKDGVARCLHKLVRTFANHGHHVFIASPVLSYIDHPNLSFYKIKSKPLFFYPDYHISLFDFKYIQSILEYKPDIIQISTPDLIGLMLFFFARRYRIPVVFIHHSDIVRVFNYFGLGFLHYIINSILPLIYNKAIITFCPTNFYKRELHQLGVKRVGIWSRGVDHTIFNSDHRDKKLRKKWGAPEKKIILYAGRLVWNKRLDILIKVYQKFQKQNKIDTQFVLVGEGPILSTLVKKMPTAIFTGFLEGEELGTAIASGDLFLFPSDTDTFGQVVQEALSCGLPAIVSNVGGCQEIVHSSRAGMVISNNDVNAYYQACYKTLNDSQLYKKMRQNGIEFTRHRNWDSINLDLLKKYEKIVSFWQHKKAYKRYQRLGDSYRINIFTEIQRLLKRYGIIQDIY
ncbi:MAG: glycosyltransferase family 1 protein [Candidatus Lokiarchaeota archaeon]|nr:glycosyltransferase family 1 protein [Candidatus Harpocratesius repetitus]